MISDVFSKFARLVTILRSGGPQDVPRGPRYGDPCMWRRWNRRLGHGRNG